MLFFKYCTHDGDQAYAWLFLQTHEGTSVVLYLLGIRFFEHTIP